MRFSVDIKNEVTRLDSSKEELISELSAIVRNSADISRPSSYVYRSIFLSVSYSEFLFYKLGNNLLRFDQTKDRRIDAQVIALCGSPLLTRIVLIIC